MAEIVRAEAAEKAGKEKESLKKYEEKGPDAGKKLEKSGRKVDSLTRAEIESILYIVYNKTLSGSKLRKADYVQSLEKEMEGNIGKYDVFVASLM